jgi:hypothetical protein
VERLEPVLGELALDELLETGPGVAFGREKEGPDRVLAGRREFDVERVHEEVVGNLQEDSSAVTGVGFGAGRSAVFEVREQFKAVRDGAVRGVAVEVHYHPDTAVRAVVVGVREPGYARGGVPSFRHTSESLFAG